MISGSNDPLSQRAYRSNFNLLVTIHPQTKQVLTTFIPRTLAVTSKCQEQNACPQGVSEERFLLLATTCIEALKQSLEETLDIPIDFTVRIDFSKLIELFDLIHRCSINKPMKSIPMSTFNMAKVNATTFIK